MSDRAERLLTAVDRLSIHRTAHLSTNVAGHRAFYPVDELGAILRVDEYEDAAVLL